MKEGYQREIVKCEDCGKKHVVRVDFKYTGAVNDLEFDVVNEGGSE